MRRFLNKQAILWWCNWQRIKRGRLPRLRLRRGLPWSGTSCPVARTLGDAWVGGSSWHWFGGRSNGTPERVGDFLMDFDVRRVYPELVDRKALADTLGSVVI